MKIGIISDIHGYLEKFKIAEKYMEGCDMILCAGDLLYHGPRNPILEGYEPLALAEYIKTMKIPMLIAKGNCDAEVDEMVLNLPLISPVVVYEKDNRRFMVLHGHAQGEERLREIAALYKVDVMITGHTHIKKCERFENTLFINPGSVSLPKDGTPSIVIVEAEKLSFIDIASGKVLNQIVLE